MESKIQSDIVQYLQSIGIFTMSVPNEAKRSMALAARLKAMGMRSGAADLVALLPGGVAVFLEVKTPTGKQSPAQVLFQSKVTELGFQYHVVRSVSDVRQIMVNLPRQGVNV